MYAVRSSRVIALINTLLALALFGASQLTWGAGSCSNSNVQPVTFGTINVSANTPVGKVLASTAASLTVQCSGGYPSGAYSGFYLQAENDNSQHTRVLLSDGSYAWKTSIPGIGIRIKGTTNTTGLNISGLQPGQWDAYYSNEGSGSNLGPVTFTFQYDLVVIGALSTGGSITGALWTDVFHDVGNNASGIMSGSQASAGIIIVNPVTPSCDLNVNTANQTISLGQTSTKDLPSLGSTANPTGFTLSLVNCVPQTAVTVTMAGTTDAANDQLKNVSGSAGGVAIQILFNNSPINFNAAFAAGNVGSSTALDIPLVARYYRNGVLTAGTVSTVATANFTYN